MVRGPSGGTALRATERGVSRGENTLVGAFDGDKGGRGTSVVTTRIGFGSRCRQGEAMKRE